MSAFLQEFQLEAEDNLNVLEQGLLQLEELGNPEVVRKMFTAAHTIKGSAGMLGLTQIQQLTHQLEDVLDSLRKNPRPLSALQASVLLEVVDEVRAMCETVLNPTPRDKPLQHWLDRLKQWEALQDPADPPPLSLPPSNIAAAEDSGPAPDPQPAPHLSTPPPRALHPHVLIYDVSMTARMHQAWLLLEAGFSVRFVSSLDQLREDPASLWLIGFDGEADTQAFLHHLTEHEQTGVMVSVSDPDVSLPLPLPWVTLNLLDTPLDNVLVQTARKLWEVKA